MAFRKGMVPSVAQISILPSTINSQRLLPGATRSKVISILPSTINSDKEIPGIDFNLIFQFYLVRLIVNGLLHIQYCKF